MSGSLPGDQLHPFASLTSLGGFMTWNDGASDGYGQGISAQALDRRFAPVPGKFRVNQIVGGDQEFAQSVLFTGGGALFVWQGGSPGRQNIYARFLSATNSWLTGDVLVNSYTNDFKKHPVAVALPGGNAAILWESYNQANSTSGMDIYGQIVSPSGQKIGSEFAVNQFNSYNQRNPAIGVLSDGGFVATWISEQQRSSASAGTVTTVTNQNGTVMAMAPAPSVDVYGRIFNADGSARSGEFLVNTTSNICLNPTIAGGANGSFLLAWSELDSINLTNGLDIFARIFSNGAPVSGAVRVNTYTSDNQFAPRASRIGSDYMVVWTSLFQDGSGEGVYGQFVGADGALSGSEFRVNTTTVSKQLQPAVASDGTNRFLALWTSFMGGSSGFDLFGKVYASSNYVADPSTSLVYAPPANDPFPIIYPWAGLTNNGPTNPHVIVAGHLDFPPSGLLTDTGALFSVFGQAQGSYNGLFADDTNGVSASSAGYFTAKTTSRGAYTGKLLLHGRTYPFSGRFSSKTGWATNAVVRRPGTPLQLRMLLDNFGGDFQILGTVSDPNGWTSDLQSDRLVFDKRKNPATTGGTINYTMYIQPDTNAAFGYGYGNVKVDAGGGIKWSGALADGTKVTQSSTLSKEGYWPLFTTLYGGNGVAMSWMQFTNSDLDGIVVWLRPPGPRTKLYPGGFTNTFESIGSMYPRSALRVTGPDKGMLVFSGGGLSAAFTNEFSVDIHKRVTSPAANKLSLTITPSTGIFKGSTRDPITHRIFTFQGILLENGTNGVGLFLGSQQSGAVELNPQP
jgi:hypothetical protein